MINSIFKTEIFLILWSFLFLSQSFASTPQEYTTDFTKPEEIRVTLGVNSSGISFKAKVNDIEIPIGDFKHRIKAIQLFHKKHSIKAEALPEFRGLFCLNEGRNIVNISLNIDDINEYNKDKSVMFYINALPYDKYIVEYRASELDIKEIKFEFYVYKKMPAGFKTITIE